MKLATLGTTILFLAILSFGQDVRTSPVKGGVNVSITANQPYEVMSGQKKTPVLSIECTQNQKASKVMHLVMFSAGENVAEDNAETRPKNGEIHLNSILGGNKETTNWIPYGDAVTYAFYGKTEPERAKFLQLLLASPTFSVEFTPFLTGNIMRSDFDIVKLKAEVIQHAECTTK
jgi:hypothetical protein